MKLRLVLLFSVFLVAMPLLRADEGHHHDPTAEELGTVNFQISCSPQAQATFTRGVALLHSFWYEEAEKAFTQVGTEDPKCAMAGWGRAMSLYHQLWGFPDDAKLKAGRALLAKAQKQKPATEREASYVKALAVLFQRGKMDSDDRSKAYSEAMGKVYQRYPEDREAAIFYALSLLGSEPEHDTTFVNRKKAAAILEKLFIEEPNHPGVAHYLIHSYDKPQLAELGLPAARRYAQIAPASPHALHMPSHIFARTGMWQDDIASNLASIEATRKTAAMHMGGAGHQFHAMDYLVYAYLQSGHEADAQKVVDDVRKMTPDSHDGTWDGYYALTKYPALIALEMRHWGDAAKLEVIKGSAPIDLAITYYARTIGAARSGDAKAARKEIANLESTEKSLVGKKGKYGADEVEQLHNIASAWLAHAEGRNEEALKALGQLADKEDAEGPEQTATPVREMLADMLMELNRPQEALAQFETTLKANPGRFNGLYGAAQAAERAGKSEQANTYYARLVKSCEGSGSVRPELDRARTLLAKN